MTSQRNRALLVSFAKLVFRTYLSKDRKMPIHDDTNAASAQAYGTAAPAAPQAEQANVGEGWGFFTQQNPAGISRNATSQVLTKAKNVFEEFYKEKLNMDPSFRVTVLPIDNSVETALYLSGLVVAVDRPDHKGLGVSYFTLLLEASNEPLSPIVEQFNNSPVHVERYAGDVYNSKYETTVKAIVQRAFPGRDVRSNTAQVVPRSFNWLDEDAVRKLAINSIFPDVTDLQMAAPDFRELDLSKWNKDAKLQVQLNFNEADRTDYVGLPIANSVAITLTAFDANSKNDQRAVNTAERTRVVSRVGGFIDLDYLKGQPMNQYGTQQQQGPLYRYRPHFVITGLENLQRVTPGGQLLALQTALALSEGNNWFPYFAPRGDNGKGSKLDIRDVGAINFEANIYRDPSGFGPRIKTDRASFSDLDLGNLLSQAIEPIMSYSIDVSEYGSDTWYNEIFAAAAAGDLNAQRAIIESADVLTGGRLSQIYKGNMPVLVNNNRVLLGYYTDANGQVRDIREVGYLAMLNYLGESSMEAVAAWSDTFTRDDYPEPKRLAERRKMLVEVVRSEITFTGYAKRCTVDGAFLVALAQAIHACGVDQTITSPSFGTNYISARGTAGYLSQSGVPQGMSGLFNMGYGNNPAAGGGYGGQRFGSGRW